jgi:hypothetical protein
MTRFKRMVVIAAVIGAFGAAAATGAGWKWSVPKGHALHQLPQRHSHPIQQADGWTWD